MTQELTLTERAQQALGFATAKEELAALAVKSIGIVEITNKAGRDQAHRAMMDLKERRLTIQKTGKAAREDAKNYAQAVIDVEKELVSVIEPEEKRLQLLRDEWDEAREAEKREAERLEAERIRVMVNHIAAINAIPGRLFGAGVAELETAILRLQEDPLEGFDEVYQPSADKAKADTLELLNRALTERRELDRQAEELKRAQEEAEAARRAEEERLAEARRQLEAEQAQAAAARAEADRLAQEERDRLAAEAKAEQDRIRAEQEARQRELDAQAEVQAAAAREAAEKAAQEQAERDAQEAERLAAEAAAANEAHRESVRAAAIRGITELTTFTEAQATILLSAIEAGLVPHVTINY